MKTTQARRATAPAPPASPASSCIKAMGLPHDNVILCDTKGVVYQGRTEGMNQWKSAHAVKTEARTLAEAMDGADVVLRPVGQGRASRTAMVKSMAQEPDHLRHGQSRPRDHAGGGRARSAPTPSSPPAARTIRTRSTTCSASPTSSAARSTCAPRTINEEMKIAAAEALAELAREDVPDEVAAAYPGQPPAIRARLHHPGAVRSAPDLGDPARPSPRRRWIPAWRASRSLDMDDYAHELSARRDPIAAHAAAHLSTACARQPKRVVFAEGEEEQVIRAAVCLRQPEARHGRSWSAARTSIARERAGTPASTSTSRGIEIINARLSHAQRRLCRLPLRAPAAQGLPVPRLPAADQQRPQPSSPPAWWRWATPTRMVTGVTRNYSTALRRRPPRHRRQARPPRHRRLDRARAAAARCSSPTPPCTTCRTPSSSPTSPRRRRASRAAWATSRASRMLAYSTFGHPRRRALGARPRGGQDPRQAPASISSMTARWRPTWRSTRG